MNKPTGRSFRVFLILVVIGVVLWGVTWVAASWIAPRVIHRALPLIAAQAEAKGIILTDLAFSDVKVSPFFNLVALKSVEAKFDLQPNDDIRLQSVVTLGVVEVRLRRLWRLRGSVAARGVDVRFDPSDLPRSLPYGHLFDAEAVLKDLPLANPRAAVDEVREGLMDLFKEGSVEGDAIFAGRVRIVVDGAEAVGMIFTEHKEGRFRLRFEEDAIRSLAKQLELDLADEQFEIVSAYPLHVPVIMQITDRARDVARREAPGDFWLEDAMRHVFWSFLLTNQFGPKFALLVTDAQEMRPGNTPDERAMDFHNNAVGRNLAAEGVSFGALPDQVRTDPGIIRDPEEVGSFGDRLLR